jgi:diguanylate cyclase (GGDEF)-like protein
MGSLAEHGIIMLLGGAVVTTVGLCIGFAMGRSGQSTLEDEIEQRRDELARSKRTTDEKTRAVAKMRQELTTVASLARSLPQVVRELNRDDIAPTDVPRLILQLAEAIFQPEQLLLYGIARGNGPDGPRLMLRLSLHHGFQEVPEELNQIPSGHGKIGWVAAHQLDMVEEDWSKVTYAEGKQVPTNHPSFSPDIIGPLIHHVSEGNQVLGVLCVGKPKIRPRDEKLMFQMVTNFGSLALINSWNMKRLRDMANNDGLTGLLNKRCFLGSVARNSLVECEKAARPFSLFIFDIDHFKTYNDTNGHPAGDDLLRKLSAMVRENIRDIDLACRYGGEEFVIAMPNTEKEEALRLANELRQLIADHPFEHRENQPSGIVSISGGVASFPKDGSSVSELLQKADQALYVSKKGGRNAVGVHREVEIGNSDFPEGDDVLTPEPAGVGDTGMPVR